MRAHFSSIPRVALVGVISLALSATLGFAQPKAEKTPQSAPAPQYAPAPQGQTASAEPGVLVVAVQPGSPAAKAGLVRGDIILEAEGTAVNTPRDVRKVVDSRRAGDTVALKVRHGDAQKDLSVTLGTQSGEGWMGVQLYADGPRLGEGLERMHGMGRFEEGALVESVAPGSPAEKAGVKQGDVILSVDGTKIGVDNNLADVVSVMKIGDTVTLSVQSLGQAEPARNVKVTLEKNPTRDVPYLGVQYTMARPRFGDANP